eukprot:767260-Hanusia_phi.AAC.1
MKDLSLTKIVKERKKLDSSEFASHAGSQDPGGHEGTRVSGHVYGVREHFTLVLLLSPLPPPVRRLPKPFVADLVLLASLPLLSLHILVSHDDLFPVSSF